MTSRAVRKYLEAHAEPEARMAARVDGSFDHVIVIPAVRESEELFDGVEPAARGASGRTLLVLVVNETEGARNDVREANRDLLAAAQRRFETRDLGGGAFFGSGEAYDALVVDRTGERAMRADQGVGTARKVGGDVALDLQSAGTVRSEWIHYSDGDATQPEDRFRIEAGPDVAAIAHRFAHEPSGDAELDAAIRRYEVSLRYYVLGLASAGSPFAFHTIGSTLTVRATSYAKVRGMPHRAAGEDFYFLNKLAKVGSVERGGGGAVRLRNRRSDRVPFGTGAALPRIIEASRRGEPFRMYDPRVFAALGAWLAGLASFAVSGENPLEVAAGRLPPGEIEALRAAVSSHLPVLRKLHAQHPPGGRLAALHTSFDAFRTLKLLHALRDRGRPDVPWREALSRAEFLDLDGAGDAREIGRRLEERELV